MSYVSQGTVQVECESGTPEIAVTISPCSEYAIKHRGKKYIAFVKRDIDSAKDCTDARVYEESKTFVAKGSAIRTMLVQAAFSGTRVEVEIDATGSPEKIVAVKIPAAPQV
jgi:hypothetical protein